MHFGAKQILSKHCERAIRRQVFSTWSVESFINYVCCLGGWTFLSMCLNGLRRGIRKQSSWALKLQAVRMNSAQSRTASRQPFQAHTVYTGGIALKQKAIYLLNTPSGLFIAVVQGTHPLKSQCPPSCWLCSGKSKWLFHWMRYVKPLGQIAGTHRTCRFPHILLRSGGHCVSQETHQLWRGSSCCCGRLSHRLFYI